jgi:hypothetical protein
VVSSAGTHPFELSPSGTRLAYSGSVHPRDTIRVLTLAGSELAAEAEFVTDGLPGIKGFSPEGGRVVWGDGAGIHMASVDDGSVRLILPPPVDPGPLTHVMAPQVFWEGGDPHLLVAYPSEAPGGLVSSVYDVSGITGVRHFLGELPLAVAAPREIARSADGQAFAAYVPIAIVSQSVESTVYRNQLVVQTSPGGPIRNVFERVSGGWLGWLEFSPDGRRLGLAHYNGVYVVRLDEE